VNADLLILGVGNLLMSDDGIGVHAAQELARHPPAGVCVVDAGTDFLSALSFMEGARRVLILDAVQGRGAPGTIHRLAQAEILPRPDGSPAHTTSVLEARRLWPPGAAWPEITVLGVEPFRLEYSMKLSAPVAQALPRLVALAREIISSWQNSPSSNATDQVAL
jgi:hydrogenase maturation protease